MGKGQTNNFYRYHTSCVFKCCINVYREFTYEGLCCILLGCHNFLMSCLVFPVCEMIYLNFIYTDVEAEVGFLLNITLVFSLYFMAIFSSASLCVYHTNFTS